MNRRQQRNALDANIEDEDVTLLVAKARALALKITGVRLRDRGVDLKHYAVLAALEPSQAPSQRELADYLRLEARRLRPLLNSMESEGLIRRTTGQDRRSHAIELTDAGRVLLAECREVVADAEEEYLRPLTEEQREQLRDLLLAIARSRVLDYNLVG